MEKELYLVIQCEDLSWTHFSKDGENEAAEFSFTIVGVFSNKKTAQEILRNRESEPFSKYRTYNLVAIQENKIYAAGPEVGYVYTAI